MPNQMSPQYKTPQMMMTVPAQMPTIQQQPIQQQQMMAPPQQMMHGTNGTIVLNGKAAAIGRAACAAVGPATALCLIRNGITHGEELLTVRGGRTGSFKQ